MKTRPKRITEFFQENFKPKHARNLENFLILLRSNEKFLKSSLFLLLLVLDVFSKRKSLESLPVLFGLQKIPTIFPRAVRELWKQFKQIRKTNSTVKCHTLLRKISNLQEKSNPVLSYSYVLDYKKDRKKLAEKSPEEKSFLLKGELQQKIPFSLFSCWDKQELTLKTKKFIGKEKQTISTWKQFNWEKVEVFIFFINWRTNIIVWEFSTPTCS